MRRREQGGPSFANSITNWRESDAPALVKLRMALANNWRKLRRRRSCCGNDGEPGC
jgi:hypothetical protein